MLFQKLNYNFQGFYKNSLELIIRAADDRRSCVIMCRTDLGLKWFCQLDWSNFRGVRMEALLKASRTVADGG